MSETGADIGDVWGPLTEVSKALAEPGMIEAVKASAAANEATLAELRGIALRLVRCLPPSSPSRRWVLAEAWGPEER